MKSLIINYLPWNLITNEDCQSLIKKAINLTPMNIEKDLNNLSENERKCYTSAVTIIKDLDDDYPPKRAVQEYIKKLWLNFLRKKYMENKNFASRSEIKNNAVKIKSEWDVAKNIIEKLLKGM